MIRRDNLRLLMKQNRWSKADLAREIDKTDAYVAKLLRPGESFGEKTARAIEQRAGKQRGWLDQVHLDGDYTDETLVGDADVPKVSEGTASYHTGYGSDSLIPVLTWERITMLGLENSSAELTGVEVAPSEGPVGAYTKWVVMPDNSMTGNPPSIPESTRLKVESEPGKYRLQPGKIVLVSDKHGTRYIRKYKPVSTNHFLAEPMNSDYATLDSQRDGLVVLGLVYQALIDL